METIVERATIACTSAAVLVSALTLTALKTQALADPMPATAHRGPPRTEAVSYADLDLRSPAAGYRLRRRIELAVRNVCGDRPVRELRIDDDCKTTAWKAEPQLAGAIERRSLTTRPRVILVAPS
jgi:UrcA family protein